MHPVMVVVSINDLYVVTRVLLTLSSILQTFCVTYIHTICGFVKVCTLPSSDRS